MEFTGTVVRKPFAPLSKSAHVAVFLVTDTAEYKLERHDGNPCRDEVLEALVGSRIECAGTVIGHVLRMSKWQVLP
jgi:hypothetical protein